MNILAIDPGPESSSGVMWINGQVRKGGVDMFFESKNDALLYGCSRSEKNFDVKMDIALIEMVASYGMAVGREVFETVFWIGRFCQRLVESGIPVQRVYRMEVKVHHCQSARAKDGNVRQALIDKYGGKGTKKQPGFFYGISSHAWSACALAAMHHETKGQHPYKLPLITA